MKNQVLYWIIGILAVVLIVAAVMALGDGGVEEAMMEDESIEAVDEAMQGEEMMDYSGAVLAGTSAKLLDFNKTDYEAAIASDKLVALYFYADWCPICRAEFPKMQSAFNGLSTDAVVGFRVNFNDSQTDTFEKDLARQYGVTYQHTKVFVKNGERVLKSPESWDEARYVSEINARLN